MAYEKAPAFQFYPKDFLTDERVLEMSYAERGIYITLLSVCWMEGSLPGDISQLAKLVKVPAARFRKVWAGALSRCFQSSEAGRLTQKRLDAERVKQSTYRQRQSKKGSAGADARWHRPHSGHASAIAQAMPTDGSPISDLPSPISISRKHKDSAFDRFWSEYPRKVGKGEAQKAWEKKRPNLELVIAALTLQREWLAREGGKYIPNPATWLNQERYYDEPPKTPGTSFGGPICPHHNPPCVAPGRHDCHQRTILGEKRWKELRLGPPGPPVEQP